MYVKQLAFANSLSRSMAGFVARRPWLNSMLKPVATWYINAAGWRRLGLRHDDLLIEENDTVLAAIKRLPPDQLAERTYRSRRAIQYSIQQKELPENEWTKPDQDVHYLQPFIRQIESEAKERELLDSLTVVNRKGGH